MSWVFGLAAALVYLGIATRRPQWAVLRWKWGHDMWLPSCPYCELEFTGPMMDEHGEHHCLRCQGRYLIPSHRKVRQHAWMKPTSQALVSVVLSILIARTYIFLSD